MSKIKNGGLDQYGTKPFEQQQFGTAGVEGVNTTDMYSIILQKLIYLRTDMSLCDSISMVKKAGVLDVLR